MIAQLFVTLFFLILFTSPTLASTNCQNLSSTEAINSCNNYVSLEQKYGDRFLNSTDEEALLSQSYTYVMRSYVDMYLATLDTTYLDKLIKASDTVLANRDDSRGVVDYLGLSTAGWRCKQYSKNGEYYRFVMHSGSIIYPMLRYAEIVKKDPSLPLIYHQKATHYIAEAKKVVAAHDSEWQSAGEYGYYTFADNAPLPSPDPGLPLPHNQQLTMGASLILLHSLTNDSTYLDKATKMARRLDHSLEWIDNTNAYHWNYGWYGPYAHTEDISHGGLDLIFVLDAYRHGLYFNMAHLERFANTLTKHIARDNHLNYFVDGSDISSISIFSKYLYLADWLELGVYQPTVYQTLLNYRPPTLSDSGDVLSLLTWAKLTKLATLHTPHTFNPGDLNKDGRVNILDFNYLLTNFGNPYTILDFNAIVGNYGK